MYTKTLTILMKLSYYLYDNLRRKANGGASTRLAGLSARLKYVSDSTRLARLSSHQCRADNDRKRFGANDVINFRCNHAKEQRCNEDHCRTSICSGYPGICQCRSSSSPSNGTFSFALKDSCRAGRRRLISHVSSCSFRLALMEEPMVSST